MYNINQLDNISFAYHKMSITSLMYCNHSVRSAVSPENAPGEMYVIELESRRLYTESIRYHIDDDCKLRVYMHKIIHYRAILKQSAYIPTSFKHHPKA